jgi:hypothetical protein
MTVRRPSWVAVRRVTAFAGLAVVMLVSSGHVGSPNVFFTGKAGSYDVRVTVRPPDVVPGVARVTVRTGENVSGVSIRPVFWRAGSRGAPSADEIRRLAGEARTFEGSLWLMARGAYTVDVIVDGARGRANVLVPVASVATARLAMHPALGVLLGALGILLVAGLVNIVHKAAGESLVAVGEALDPARRRRAQRVAAIAVPILALAVFGGARWWGAVDDAYQRTIYRPSPLDLSLNNGLLRLRATDSVWQPGGRASALIPDHGKLMHLFLVRAADATAFAHLHPVPDDSSEIPSFSISLPALPSGKYNVYGDVVHETGFERTLVGSVDLEFSAWRREVADPDDAWFVGAASRERATSLADGSTMELDVLPSGPVVAGRETTFRVAVKDATGNAVALEPYLGMPAHGVVVHTDGGVYVHLHPMGTITKAAQDAFLARDRGDTTSAGRLQTDAHSEHARGGETTLRGAVEFPYAFPRSGDYRVFVQVRTQGRILTGAFAIAVTEAGEASR